MLTPAEGAMDGVDSSNNGVVVMGATNRLKALDAALTPPGTPRLRTRAAYDASSPCACGGGVEYASMCVKTVWYFK